MRRGTGDEVRSGSFATEGDGAYVVTAVGPESYAEQVAGEAREFRHPRSPLERSLDRLLFTTVGVLVPLAVILGYALWERDEPLDEAAATAVAAGVTLVPEGLILLTSLTFAVAALAMARKGALAQQLNAIESLASVDVLCLDKTGTLTEPRLRVTDVVAAPGADDAELTSALARFAASFPASNVDARGTGRELRGAGRGARGARAVLVALPLERRPPGRDDLRARRPRAATARHARRARRRRGRSRPARRRAGDDGRTARRRRPGRRPASGTPPARARRARRAPARRRRGHGALLPRPGRRAQGALRRPARDGCRDRSGRRRPHDRGATRGRRAAHEPRRAAGRRAWSRRHRPHHARRQAAGHRGPARRRPLRGHGRRRSQRRAGAEGGTPRDRSGKRNPDGAERRRRRARAQRVRGGAGHGRAGATGVPEPAAGREALRDQVGVRGRAHPVRGPDADRLSAAAAPPDARGRDHDRDTGVLPRARPERRHVPRGRLPPRRRPLRRARRARLPGSASSPATCSP